MRPQSFRKLLILVVSAFASLALSAQVPSGLPQSFNGKYYQFRNYVQVDSAIMLSARDTSVRPIKPAVVYRAADSSLYYFNMRRWQKVGSGVSVEADPTVGLHIKALTTTDTANFKLAFRKHPTSLVFDSATRRLTLGLNDGSALFDTINIAGAGADNWGSQAVVTNSSMTGDGTSLNPLKVDTFRTTTNLRLKKVIDSLSLSVGSGVSDGNNFPTSLDFSSSVLTLGRNNLPAISTIINTTNVGEGTNQYFTIPRVRSSLSAGSGIGYNSSTGVISNTSPDVPVVLNAGANISVSGTYPNFTLSASGGAGEANTASNLGASGVSVFAQKTGVDLQFRKLIAGTNMSITENANDITLSATVGGAGGEINTASNLATTGARVFAQKSGVDLQFRRFNASTGLSIAEQGDSIVLTNTSPNIPVSITAGTNINVTGPYPNFVVSATGEANTGSNLGASGARVFAQKTGVDFQYRRIVGGSGVSITENTNDITISNSAQDVPVSITTTDSALRISGSYPNFSIFTKLRAAYPILYDSVTDIISSDTTFTLSTKQNVRRLIDSFAITPPVNIYTANGTLTGPRIVNMNFNKLQFNGGDIFVSGARIGLGPYGGLSNTALGYQALDSSFATGNTAVGSGAGKFLKNQGNNTLVGYEAGLKTIGYNNTYVGKGIASFNTQTGAASRNTAMGENAMWRLVSGDDNNAFGSNALVAITTGNDNTVLGSYSMNGLTTGSNNVAIGVTAASYYNNGNNNVFIGHSSGIAAKGSGNVFLGYGSGFFVDSTDNKLIIHNDGAADPMIYGDFAADTLRLNSSLSVRDVPPGTADNKLLVWDSAVGRVKSIPASLVSGTTYSAGNGLSLNANTFKLGGTLSENTNFAGNDKTLTAYNTKYVEFSADNNADSYAFMSVDDYTINNPVFAFGSGKGGIFQNAIRGASPGLQFYSGGFDATSGGPERMRIDTAGKLFVFTPPVQNDTAIALLAINRATGQVHVRDAGTLGAIGGGEANTGSSLGSTGARVFAQKVGVDLQFRRITSGSGISVSENTNDVSIVNTAPDQVVTLTGGTNVTVTGSYPSFTISAAGGSSGEVNTASNLGTGQGVFAQKSGVDLQFKSIKAGTNVSVSSTATEVTINAAAGDSYTNKSVIGGATFWNYASNVTDGADARHVLSVGSSATASSRTITVNAVLYVTQSNFTGTNQWVQCGLINEVAARPSHTIYVRGANIIDATKFRSPAAAAFTGNAVYGDCNIRIDTDGKIFVYITSVTSYPQLSGANIVVVPIHVTYFTNPAS